jgi:hypothetical protein
VLAKIQSWLQLPVQIETLIVTNNLLEQELSVLYAKASHGFLRSRRVRTRTRIRLPPANE